MRRVATLAALVLFAGPALAATHYIRDGGTASTSGTGSCTGWATANACDQLPTTLVRGDTYCVADGTYSGKTLDTAASGTSVITIRKAVHGDGTCDQGSNWVSTYGDGQATFGSFTVNSSYWTIDGVSRNASDWASYSAYGFAVADISSIDDFGSVYCADNLTIRYVNLGTLTGTSYTGSEPDNVLKGTGYRSNCETWTVEYSALHNAAHYCLFCANGFDGATIQYNLFANGWGKEAIRGQIAFKNATIRWNRFHDACGQSGGAGEGCTAEIALWDGSAGNWDGNEIYGNSFYRTRDENSGGTIVVGGNGGSWVGSPASNTSIYNNTIAGIAGGGSGALILVNGGSNNVCRNNLWYDVVGTGSCTASTTSNNTEVGSDPFVSYATGDLRLSGATTAGYSLSSPYNVDMLGSTRGGDGTWDLGAFEYGSGSKLPGPGNPRWRPADAWPLWFAWRGR